MLNWRKNLGLKLAGLWLILQAALPLLEISGKGVAYLMIALAIAAGVLIIMER
jgi:hypothetical protein